MKKEEKAANAEQKGPKADQAAGRLSLLYTLVEFTSRGSGLLVGLYFFTLDRAHDDVPCV